MDLFSPINLLVVNMNGLPWSVRDYYYYYYYGGDRYGPELDHAFWFYAYPLVPLFFLVDVGNAKTASLFFLRYYHVSCFMSMFYLSPLLKTFSN